MVVGSKSKAYERDIGKMRADDGGSRIQERERNWEREMCKPL
jgi:hypothetical protein